MRKDREPDLLDWEPPSGGATVIPFPQGSRIGQARVTASVIQRCKSHTTRQAALGRATTALLDKLEKIGVDHLEAIRQVDAFSRAVSLELARLQHDRRQA